MAVTPNSNLPEPSQPWGRDVETRLANLETIASRSAKDTNNLLAQLNSSIQALSLQYADITNTVAATNAAVADLNNRAGYGASDNTSWFWNLTSGTGNYTSTASVTFTLTETRQVLLLATARVFYSITNASINASLNLYINGANSWQGLGTVSIGVSYQTENPLIINQVLTLTAGTYTFENRYLVSGSGTGSAQFRGSTISASVLNKL